MRQTLFCSNCGTKISPEVKFCFNCGAKIVFIQEDEDNEAFSETESVVCDAEQTELSSENTEIVPLHAEPDESYRCSAEENEKKLESILQHKRTILFGEEICFESSYFLEKYIRTDFRQNMNKHKSKFISVLNDASKKIHLVTDYDIIVGFGILIHSIWQETVSDVLEKIPLVEENICIFQTKLTDYFNKWFNVLYSDLYDVQSIFEDIDAEINEKIIDGKIKKATRGKWCGGGFGLMGALKGAAMSSILNAGTGMLYDIKSSISVAGDKSKASGEKKQLFEKVVDELQTFINDLIEYTPSAICYVIWDEYKLKYSRCHDGEEEMYNSFENTSDIEQKQRLGIKLLKINPEKKEYYIELAELSEDLKDYGALIDISGWLACSYNHDIKKHLISKAEKMLDKYENNDIRKYDKLIEIERALHYQNPQRRTILKGYLIANNKIDLKEYTIEELYSNASFIYEFGAQYDFPVENIVEKSIRTYIYHYKNKTLTDYSFENLNQMYDILVQLFEKFGEIDSIKSAKNKMIAEIIDHNNINTDTTDISELKSSLEKLYKLNSSCKWDLSSYIKQAEKKYCTVGDIVYSTTDEADLARHEIAIMDSINSDNSLTDTEKFNRVLQQDFKTVSVKPMITEMESTLIRIYETNKRGCETTKYISSVGSFIFSLLASLVVLCIGINFSFIGIIFAIPILISIWNQYKSKYHSAKVNNKILKKYIKCTREFDNLFMIKNNHIIKK